MNIVVIFLEILISLLLYNNLINKNIFNNILKNVILALLSCVLFKIMYVFLYFIIFKIFNSCSLKINHMIIEFSIITSILLIISIHYYKASYLLLTEKKNVEINSYSNLVLEELIENIRLNEHEYKNHLNTLYSIIEVEDNKDIIKDKVEKYIGKIRAGNEITGILYIKNIIVKAIIYNKLLECNSLGIKLDYKINRDFNILLEDWELNIVLSNLLNNSIEAVKALENKYIEVKLDKSEDNLKSIIEIKNPIEDVNITEIEQFFKKGFSRKGKGRGYGLFNVKKIVKRNKGDITLTLQDECIILKIVL